MGRRRIVVLAVALVAVPTSGGCARGDRASGPPQVHEQPPAWLDTASFAALGADLAAVGDSTGDVRPQARRPDGTWIDLPILPRPGRYSTVGVGSTILAVGTLCSTDEECARGSFRMYLLSADRSHWTALNAPNVPVTEGREIYALPTDGPHAVVFIDDGYYSIDEAGLVTKLDPPDDAGPGNLCVAGDVLIRAEVDDGPTIDRIDTRDLSDRDGDWVRGAPPPPPPMDAAGPDGVLCGPDGITLVRPTTERSFSMSTGTWTTVESNYGEVADGDPLPWHLDAAAWTPDGGTAFIAPRSRVLARTGPGQWQDTLVPGAQVVSTDSAVLAVTDVPGRAVSQVWSSA